MTYAMLLPLAIQNGYRDVECFSLLVCARVFSYFTVHAKQPNHVSAMFSFCP